MVPNFTTSPLAGSLDFRLFYRKQNWTKYIFKPPNVEFVGKSQKRAKMYFIGQTPTFTLFHLINATLN